MQKINNSYLLTYVNKYQQLKSLEKEVNGMKKELTTFIQGRYEKEFITADALAFFQFQQRTVYNVPDEIKKQYSETKDYNILKVELKK